MASIDYAARGAARPQILVGGVRPEPKGWTTWITTTDHKRIGILYLWTVAVFFVLGGVEALLIRLQLGAPENTLLTPEKYGRSETSGLKATINRGANDLKLELSSNAT